MSTGLKVREAECLKYVRRDSHGQVRAQGSIYILSPLLVSSPWCQVATSVSLNTSQSLSLSAFPSLPLLSGRCFWEAIFQNHHYHINQSPLARARAPMPTCTFHTSDIYLFNRCLPPPVFLFLWFSISAPLCLSATYSIAHQPGVSFCPTSFYRSLEIIMAGSRLLWAGVLWLKRQLKKDARSNRNHGYLSPK